MGVATGTVTNWELGHRSPALFHLPRVIEFLGYVPFELGESLPERLRGYRKIHGISRYTLAGMLGVDEGTLMRWERGERQPAQKYLERIEGLLSSTKNWDQ